MSQMTPERQKQIIEKLSSVGAFNADEFTYYWTSSHWFEIKFKKESTYYYKAFNNTVTYSPGPKGNPTWNSSTGQKYQNAIDWIVDWIRILRKNIDDSEWIAQTISSRSNQLDPEARKKYDFPKLDITPEEEEWLKLVYEKYLGRESFQGHELLASNWESFSKSFDPYKVDNRLLRNGDQITLLGIWHTHPESSIITTTEKIIFQIKKLIQDGAVKDEVTSQMIVTNILNISHEDVYRSFQLLGDFGHFYGGSGYVGEMFKDNFSCSIRIGNADYFDRYRKFTGLEELMVEFVSKESGTDTKESIELETINTSSKDGVPLNENIFQTFTTKFNIVDSKVKGALNVKTISEELSKIIQFNLSETEKGNMVGVFGKWGRGKSFLMKHIKEYFNDQKEDNPFYICNFNAWKYQTTPALWVYLYEQIANTYYEDELDYEDKTTGSKWILRARKNVRLSFKRNGVWPILWFLFPVVVGVFFYFFLSKTELEEWKKIVSGISSFLVSLLLIRRPLNGYKVEAIALIKKYSSILSFKSFLGIQEEIQKELKTLFSIWLKGKRKHKRILLFVDDIDRCDESKILSIIDSLRILMDDQELSKKIVVIAAVDEKVLRLAIKHKYSNLIPEQEGISDQINVREYFDKLFILGIKLGSLTTRDKIEVFDRFVEDKVFALTDEPSLKESTDESELIQDSNRSSPFETDNNYATGSIDEIKNSNRNQSEQETHIYGTEIPFGLEINEKELRILKECIVGDEKMTPRQIRIFYYRYLFARNLMGAFTKQNGKFELWKDFDKSRLPYYIMHHSSGSGGYEDVEMHDLKERSNKNNDINQKIFEVVEMVVPY